MLVFVMMLGGVCWYTGVFLKPEGTFLVHQLSRFSLFVQSLYLLCDLNHLCGSLDHLGTKGVLFLLEIMIL